MCFSSFCIMFAPFCTDLVQKMTNLVKLGFCHIPNLAQLGIWQNPNFTKSHHFWSLDPPKGANMVQMALKHIYILYFRLRRRLRRRQFFLARRRRWSFLAVKIRGREIFFFVMERPGGWVWPRPPPFGPCGKKVWVD